MKLFVYGTLKRGHGNNHFLEECVFLGEAISAAAEFSMYGRGIPYLVKGGSQNVAGELWEVGDLALERIDRLEGHPHHYRRQIKPFVKESGEWVLAWVYLVDPDKLLGERKFEGRLLYWPPPEKSSPRSEVIGHGPAPNSGPIVEK